MAGRALLQDRAYERLKDLIQGGTFAPGTFLSERQLSRKLGMSKTPIRSALTRLDLEGFVSVSPQQGILVREQSIHEIVDLLDIRIALESFVVRSLAGKLTSKQLERLKDNLRRQAEAVKAADEVAFTHLDTGFHILLCEFLDNREIVRVMLQSREKLHRIILHVLSHASGRIADAYREHTAIGEAVIRGKGDLAAERVRKHLEFGKQFLVSR
jgi:DNA-binding GntR family transcriptional regulator